LPTLCASAAYRSAADASKLVAAVNFNGGTALGREMVDKVLSSMVYNNSTMCKPLLVITITDGEPTESPRDKIASVIKDCRKRMAARYGPNAVAFEFAQVTSKRVVSYTFSGH
jgi:uncharacterized protein YegL